MNCPDSMLTLNPRSQLPLPLHPFYKNPHTEAMVEEIIRHIVLFGDDKKLLTSWLSKTYGDRLTAAEQQLVLTKKFSGWGRLSQEFLTKIFHVTKKQENAIPSSI